jgi:hypothetical protein
MSTMAIDGRHAQKSFISDLIESKYYEEAMAAG